MCCFIGYAFRRDGGFGEGGIKMERLEKEGVKELYFV
jgi:hypothetical protein